MYHIKNHVKKIKNKQRFKLKKSFVITIDLGGTKILTALLNDDNEIIERVKISTDISKGPEYIIKSVADSINELLSKTNTNNNSIKAICLGVPGTVNPYTGLIGNAPNLQIKNFNVKDELQKYFKIPVLIENDVNLAALGIKRFEFGDNVNNMLVVFVGTGIGGALIFNGKMYRGSSYFAGEIGHMKVSSKGELSTNPDDISFENIASRTAVISAITHDIKKGKNSLLSKFIESKTKIKSKAIAGAVRDGDKVVRKHISRSCKVTGTLLGSLTTLLNIDTIVLGGGVLEALGDFMLPKIESAFKKSVLPEPGKDVKIVITKLGDDAALYGGIGLANEFLT